MSSVEHPPSLLVVDDDDIFRERLGRAFVRRGYEVRTAGNYEEAVALSEEESAEFAVVDLRMPGRQSGLDVLRTLKRIDALTRVVMLTGYGSIATTVDAMRLGATNYLPKPADADDIIRAFERSDAKRGDAQNGDAQELETPSEAGETAAEEERIRAPTLARAEWEHIHRILADCDGNISEASRRLGIHRRSLQRKLQKFAP
jgi:two-component system response regulator RegA